MQEQEISRMEWREFCDQFTRKHRGWLVSVEVSETGAANSGASSPGGRKREVARDAPLRTLAAVASPHGMSFLLETGSESRATRVLVEQPVRLRLQQADDGADEALRIDAADGQTSCLAFRAAARPETVDGLADSELGPG